MALAIRLGGELLHPGDVEGAELNDTITERDLKKILTDVKTLSDPGAKAKELRG